MRYSRLLIPTLKENPSEAEAVSHKLMIRAGLVRQLAAGLYIYLPLGLIVLDKINRILREEMNAIGGQEISMPVLHPAEVWQQTGRWNDIGDEMFRLKDRGGRDMCLGMTHEEIMTWLASMEIRSYRDLPQIWYQIQTKLRDEARPKSGVLRTREFTMKDSYSFDADEEGLDKSYQLHLEAYKKIFERSGLKFYIVESDPGMMGGAVAHEFMAPSSAGEDEIVLCGCGYAANVELAKSVPSKPEFPEWKLEEVATPDSRTIEEVSAFLKLDKRLFIKSLIVVSPKGPVMALMRGDEEVHEKKLRKLIGDFRPAHKEEVKEFTGIEAGFIGPIKCKLRIIADESLKEGVYVTGANKEGYHIKGVVPKRDFNAEFADIHTAKAGDGCPKYGKALASEKVIETGNIFKLGTKYSEPLKAYFLDEKGKERPIIMGSYGIGPARIAASAIEQNHDENGIIWPLSIAPFQVEILPLNMKNEAVKKTADEIYQGLLKEKIEVLIDDRDASPGIKFKDADLIGIPYRIIIGEKGLKEGIVEIKERRTGKVEKIKGDSAIGSRFSSIIWS
ncbi:MAG: proline--tRNA ligase [Nitrospirae bacterium]|nr:proline--tRNA ligase [Nitrospirota bacterium]